MSRHDDEPLPDVPPIVPDRDEVALHQRRKAASRPAAASAGRKPPPPTGGGPSGPSGPGPGAGSGSGGRAMPVLLTVLILALAGFGGWQQMELMAAQQSLLAYEGRVAELERRLSMTDESMSQSSVAMQVKLQELDSEIRKLWDNVWRRASARLDGHDGKISSLEKDLKTTQGSLAKAEQALAESQKSLTGLRQQVERFSRLDSSVELSRRKLEEQQVALEAAVERVNRAVADMGRLERRVAANEEWVQSINNFRQQMNRELLSLKEQISRGG